MEILVPLTTIALAFEVILPYWGPPRGRTVGHPSDVLCYSTGALVGAVWRRWRYGDAKGAESRG
jgi:hypothetical protein